MENFIFCAVKPSSRRPVLIILVQISLQFQCFNMKVITTDSFNIVPPKYPKNQYATEFSAEECSFHCLRKSLLTGVANQPISGSKTICYLQGIGIY